ncbi:hypothetical protein THASP1DRAFT_25552 [Thamnocephalis sphaerospora]|uniref:Mediator of RNA polymerase II transcription subunit 1 n=1 Tax=Thamnocephalis sphaerospora TaxID=78915 RepID=A0A4P9XJU0_9FUNG|nr:hypothetical protein THASP1DRAFT_25552 [Thamnocephalis sphaerospora]|eukprot:RKP06053.1 hypothetical protein THASP1DRAFT_25552 [Thamnocephalis sphaerospora]
MAGLEVNEVRTLDTILEDVEHLLAKAARLWSIDDGSSASPDGKTTTQPRDNAADASGENGASAHATTSGHVSLDGLRAALGERLSEARGVLTEYRDTTLPLAVAAGQTGCASLRNFSSLLKDETLLRRDVHRLRTTAQDCQRLIAAACRDESSRIKQLVNRLESIAKEHGLEVYRDTSTRDGQQHIAVMLAGAVVVVDVELTGMSAIETKVTYALPEDGTASGAASMDSVLVDQLLARTLGASDFDAFDKNLSWLAEVDKYTKLQADADGADFFHGMHVLRQDMATVFQREMSICSGDLSTVLLYGHGLPLSDRVRPGPAVAYWAPRALLVGVDWGRLNQLLTSTVSLEPGVIVTTAVAAEIARVAGLNTESTAVAATGLDFTDGSLSLFEALVHTSDPVRESRQHAGDASKQAALPPLGVYFPDHMSFRTRVHAGASVHEYALVTDSLAGAMLHRIPLGHPCQLAEIQRLVFNALFKSCFAASTAYAVDPTSRLPLTPDADPSLWGSEAVRVEMAAHNPPHSFLLSFLPPGTTEYICLEVAVSAENALPSVKRLAEFSTNTLPEQSAMLDAICHEQKMTEVARASESIPLLVHWLLRRFEENGRMDWSNGMEA